jgi:hypothetical protein
MASREDQPDPLYIVHDDDDRIVVALDMPGVHGAVEEEAYGAVELVRLVPHPVTEDGSQLQGSTISAEPPGLRAARARYGIGAVVGMSAGVVVTGAISLGVGLPVTLAAVVALGLGYRRRRGVITDAWAHRHRVLRHVEDTLAFTTARRAVERVVDAWPRIGAMVGVADPSPVLARSLWTLSEVLVRRSDLRDQRDELIQIRADLSTDTELWREVDDRVAQLNTALAALDTPRWTRGSPPSPACPSAASDTCARNGPSSVPGTRCDAQTRRWATHSHPRTAPRSRATSWPTGQPPCSTPTAS